MDEAKRLAINLLKTEKDFITKEDFLDVLKN